MLGVPFHAGLTETDILVGNAAWNASGIHTSLGFSSVRFPPPAFSRRVNLITTRVMGSVLRHRGLSGMWVLWVFGAVLEKFNTQPVQLAHSFSLVHPLPLLPPLALPSPLQTTLYEHIHNTSHGPAADVVVCERHFFYIRSSFGKQTPVH